MLYLYDDKGKIYGISVNDQIYCFMENVQGDVIGLYNEEGKICARYTYDPWGNIIGVQELDTVTFGEDNKKIGEVNPFRYRGYYYDMETGFYYLNSRYYDPQVKRFINADAMIKAPGTSVLSTNIFAYCENNPMMYSDSTGQWFLLDDIIAGVVGATVSIGSQLISDVVTSVSSGSWQFSSWQTYVGAGVGGFVGGVTTLYAGPFAGSIVGSVLTSFVTQTLEIITGKENYSPIEMVTNTIVDTSTGLFFDRFISMDIPDITVGHYNMGSTYRSTLNQLHNGYIKTMSWPSKMTTIKYGTVSGIVGNFYQSYFVSLTNLLNNQINNNDDSTESNKMICWCNP